MERVGVSAGAQLSRAGVQRAECVMNEGLRQQSRGLLQLCQMMAPFCLTAVLHPAAPRTQVAPVVVAVALALALAAAAAAVVAAAAAAAPTRAGTMTLACMAEGHAGGSAGG